MSSKQRNRVFDALKFFAIFLVLWGHSVQHLLSSEYYTEPVYRIIYSFHMPLFMILVGFFGTALTNHSFLEAFKRKSRQLLLPSIIWGGVIGLFSVYYSSILMGISNFYSSFWFLKSAFICSLLYYLTATYISKKYRILVIFISLILCQFIDGFNINIMYPCFIFGVLINKNYLWIKGHVKKLIPSMGVVFVIMLLFWNESFWTDRSGLQLHDVLGDYSKFIYQSYLNLYRIIIGLVGSLFFISLFEYLGRFVKPNKFENIICRWGQYTLGIYILQTFILENFFRKLLCFDNTSFGVFNFILAPGISLITLFICVLCIEVIQKNKLLALLCFGKKVE